MASSPKVALLAERIKDIPKDRVLVVVTGAGVSLASGIPTFRGTDPGAVWAKDVTELGTFRYFCSEPAGSWQWYLSRFDQLRTKEPNAAHHALAKLEQWQLNRNGSFLLITQNVDCLHEAAGSSELIKVHGSTDRVRCTNTGRCELAAPQGSIKRDDVDMTTFLQNPVDSNVPRCPNCNFMLRQHVLWFDETYDQHDDYQIDRVLSVTRKAGITLFIGTSFSVGLTDMVVRQSLSCGSRMFSLDPSGIVPHSKITPVARCAEDVLPEVLSLLAQ